MFKLNDPIEDVALGAIAGLEKSLRKMALSEEYKGKDKDLVYIREGDGRLAHKHNEWGYSSLIFKFDADEDDLVKLKEEYGRRKYSSEDGLMELKNVSVTVGNSTANLDVSYYVDDGYVQVAIGGYLKEDDPEAVKLMRKELNRIDKVTSKKRVDHLISPRSR